MRIVLVDPSRAIQRAMTELIVPGDHEVLAFSEGQKALDCIGAEIAFALSSRVYNSRISQEFSSAQLLVSWSALVVRFLLW